MRRADHPAVGLIVDSFHTLARKTDVDTIRSIPGDRIFFVQLADAPMIDMDLLATNVISESDYILVGTQVFRVLADTGVTSNMLLLASVDSFADNDGIVHDDTENQDKGEHRHDIE